MKRIGTKKEILKRCGIRVMELFDRDIEELDDRLSTKLLQFFLEGCRFQ